jgi:NAD(P)-dependent dehydrogenase (short-subunit alcohol dehydrogenase family)
MRTFLITGVSTGLGRAIVAAALDVGIPWLALSATRAR